MCFEVPPKISWISQSQIIWQWIPNCWSGDRKSNGFQRCCGEHLEQTVDDTWQIIDADDQELQTLAHSSQWDILEMEPGGEDNDGPSRRACTAASEEQSTVSEWTEWGWWSLNHRQLFLAKIYYCINFHSAMSNGSDVYNIHCIRKNVTMFSTINWTISVRLQ